jgi:hypothetical protein
MPMTKSPAARRFMATVAAAATALALMTAAAVPARADSDDAARALALIATVAILGKVLDDRNKRRDQPVAHPARRDVLPRVCAIEIDTGRRIQTVYSGPCLREEGVRARLPRQCEGTVRMRGRTVPVYGQACLIDAGFRPERGRDAHRHWDRRD